MVFGWLVRSVASVGARFNLFTGEHVRANQLTTSRLRRCCAGSRCRRHAVNDSRMQDYSCRRETQLPEPPPGPKTSSPDG